MLPLIGLVGAFLLSAGTSVAAVCAAIVLVALAGFLLIELLRFAHAEENA
jgi:hypothetical protein